MHINHHPHYPPHLLPLLLTPPSQQVFFLAFMSFLVLGVFFSSLHLNRVDPMFIWAVYLSEGHLPKNMTLPPPATLTASSAQGRMGPSESFSSPFWNVNGSCPVQLFCRQPPTAGMSSWVQQPRHALKSAFHSPSSHALTLHSFPPSLKPRGNYIDVSNRAWQPTVAYSAHFWPLMSLCITHCKQNWEIFLLTKWPTERHRHAKFLHSSNKLQSLSMKLKIILLTYVWDLIYRINTLFSKLSKKWSPLHRSLPSLLQPMPCVLKIGLLLLWITCRWMHSDKPTNCIDSHHRKAHY